MTNAEFHAKLCAHYGIEHFIWVEGEEATFDWSSPLLIIRYVMTGEKEEVALGYTLYRYVAHQIIFYG